MRRRKLLQVGSLLAGSLLGAGCSAPRRPGATTPGFELRDSVLQSAAPMVEYDYFTIVQPENAQFLFCHVTGNQRQERLTLHTDDGSFVRARPFRNPFVVSDTSRTPYSVDRLRGWVAFDIPRLETAAASLRADEGGRELRTEVVEGLATAPEFELRRLERDGECVTFDVRNVGDADGTFYVALENGKEGDWYSRDIPAGGTTSFDGCIRTYGSYGITVLWGRDEVHLSDGETVVPNPET